MRAWFGPVSQIASIAGSATMSAIDAYAFASPMSSDRAYAAALSARSRFGLHTPRTSASRTPIMPSMWNRALKPEPTKPMPNRSLTGRSYCVREFGQDEQDGQDDHQDIHPVHPAHPVQCGSLGWNARPHHVLRHAQLRVRFRRAAVPFRVERVADVLHVLPAHGAREEARRHLVAEA